MPRAGWTLKKIKKLVHVFLFDPRNDVVWGTKETSSLSKEYFRDRAIVIIKQLDGTHADWHKIRDAIRLLLCYYMREYAEIPTQTEATGDEREPKITRFDA